MKKIYLLLFLLFKLSALHAQWSINDSSYSIPFQSVYFMNADTGFVTNPVGSILRTINGGKDWERCENTGNWGFDAIFCTPNLNVYAVGVSGLIRKSVDLGFTWTLVTVNKYETLHSVYFIDNNKGYAVGGGWRRNSILKTTNSFKNWTEQTMGSGTKLSSVFFPDSLHGYVVGDSATIYKTKDGGVNWHSISSFNKNIHFHSQYFTDSIKGFVVGDAGTILKTIDGGINWINQSSNTEVKLRSIYFVDANNGYIVGDQGTILNTSNGGTSWIHQGSFPEIYLSAVCFSSASVGYAVGGNGNNGSILKFEMLSDGLFLKKTMNNDDMIVYPNPCHDKLIVESKIHNNNSTLSITNFTGQVIVNKNVKDAKTQFYMNHLSNGTYFLKLKTDNIVTIRKIIKN